MGLLHPLSLGRSNRPAWFRSSPPLLQALSQGVRGIIRVCSFGRKTESAPDSAIKEFRTFPHAKDILHLPWQVEVDLSSRTFRIFISIAAFVVGTVLLVLPGGDFYTRVSGFLILQYVLRHWLPQPISPHRVGLLGILQSGLCRPETRHGPGDTP